MPLGKNSAVVQVVLSRDDAARLDVFAQVHGMSRSAAAQQLLTEGLDLEGVVLPVVEDPNQILMEI
jgi:hypothetical protein